MHNQFAKLYAQILTSTVWQEPEATRLVWITMLALKDEKGYVGASVPGLAHVARVSMEDCEKAIATLESPDPHSRTKDFDGRRIEAVDGGWLLLNADKYRDKQSPKQAAVAERVRKHREKKAALQAVTDPIVTLDTDTDTDTDTDFLSSSTPNGLAGKYRGTTICTAGFVEDMLELESRIVKAGGSFTAWLAEMAAATQGMHPPVRTPEEIGQAVRDFNASGADISLRLFRGYLRGNGPVYDNSPAEAKPGGKAGGFRRNGKTLAATELAQKLRGAAQPNPYTGGMGLVPGWQEGFDPTELRVIKAVGTGRILNDPNEGTLISQMAKALEEASE